VIQQPDASSVRVIGGVKQNHLERFEQVDQDQLGFVAPDLVAAAPCKFVG
jgi:hypothetical protein